MATRAPPPPPPPPPPEVELARRLAGNERAARERALRRLRGFIAARTRRAGGWAAAPGSPPGPPAGFSRDELLRVWKGLFYCLWLQDRPLLQEQLGGTIARLVHDFQTPEAQLLFVQTFWQTVSREWTGIDRLRLDKFYSLMRMVLRESLRTLQARAWEPRHAERLLELLTSELLRPDSPAPGGVRSHFLEVFLEELTRVGAAELTAEQNLRFIEPFCTIAAKTRDPLVLHGITRGILEALVEQAPLAVEDLMRELDSRALEEEDEDDEDGGGQAPRTGHPTGPARQVGLEGEEEEEEEAAASGSESEDEEARPVLQFDYAAVASRLFEVASQQDTPSRNRKRLYKVVRKLQQLAEGLFPEDELPKEVCQRLQEGRRRRTGGKRKRRRPSTRPRGTGEGGKEEKRQGGQAGRGGDSSPQGRGPEQERRRRKKRRGLGGPE